MNEISAAESPRVGVLRRLLLGAAASAGDMMMKVRTAVVRGLWQNSMEPHCFVLMKTVVINLENSLSTFDEMSKWKMNRNDKLAIISLLFFFCDRSFVAAIT